MITYIQAIGRASFDFCRTIGHSGFFVSRVIFQRPRWSQVWPLLAIQLYRVGVLSTPIVVLSALFIGMVVSLQGYFILQKFGASQELGELLALSVIRELSPVVTALLFAGRAGSALTAEIGLMRATDQLDCMEVMAVSPLYRVVAPRFWAGLISLPILTLLFSLIAIYSGYWLGVGCLNINDNFFWSNLQSAIHFYPDIINQIIKSLVFGFVVIWVSVYQGYFAQPNPGGVSDATTKTVVYSSLMVLMLDFILTIAMVVS